MNKMEMLKGITTDLISLAQSIKYNNNDEDYKHTYSVLTEYGWIARVESDGLESREDYLSSPIKIKNGAKPLTDVEIVTMLLDVAKQLKKDLIKDIESL